MKFDLLCMAPAYIPIEIPDGTDEGDAEDVAREIFDANPREHVVYSFNGYNNRGICDPKDVEFWEAKNDY